MFLLWLKESLSPKEICDFINVERLEDRKTNTNAVKQILFRMIKQERIIKQGYGKYTVTSNTHNSSNCDNTSNTSNSLEEENSFGSSLSKRVTSVMGLNNIENNSLSPETQIDSDFSKSVTSVTRVTQNMRNRLKSGLSDAVAYNYRIHEDI